ncbi:BQ5605_C001g00097 [Microbotryum silenes-dioicae]|uniref:BQ5605_C001g00097 protein n=1 Tax=Microbotryum silenes-dioicae TaxID=796604 RepID=A0A2X0M6N5_9BASI|nr:BQ5605_C001g00097 [Microbotryum silenes-dioicae]
MAVCINYKARHWEYKRSKSTGHYSTCCSQGKVQLPPLSGPIPNIEIYLKDSGHIPRKRPVAQQRAVFHFDQTRIGTLGLPVFRVFGRLYHRLGALIPAVNQRPAFAQTWLIDPAETTDTLLGPDSPDSRIQRSTLTKLEFKLWVLRLCLPPGRDRRTHNLPTSSTEMAMLICDSDTNTGDRGPQDLILQVHGDRCPDGRPKYQVVSSLHPSAMPLRYPLLFPAGEDGFHPNIPLCGSIELGHSSPKDRNKEGEDEEEGDEENGDAQTDIECLNTYDEGQVKGVKVVSLAFTNPLRSTCTNATSPHGTQRPFPAFVIERYSQAETDRLNYIQLH